MTLLTQPILSTAEQRARGNFAKNCLALSSAQADRVAELESVALSSFEWLQGRDASLTARIDDARWLGGTSLPLRVAQAQLKQLKLYGPVCCFLDPPHARSLRVALDRAAEEQAIIAIVPSIESLAAILHCEDFSSDLRAARLWFVAGENWSKEFPDLLARESGVSIPTQFIRLNTAHPEIVDPLITEAQSVFSAATADRSERAIQLRNSWSLSGQNRLCVVAPSRFRLWNDWGDLLRDIFASDGNVEWIDCDDPRSTSSLSLCAAATRCDAFFAANFARSDAPLLLPDDLPWTCWSTNGRVPAFVPTSPRDRLIIIDEIDRARALKLGWPREAILLEAPLAKVGSVADNFEADLTVIADSCSIDIPERLKDFSSQVPMWESIASEIAADPLQLLDIELGQFLDDRAQRFNVPTSTLDVPLFIDRLIVPAYQQAIVKKVIDAGFRIAIYGSGWSDLPFATACTKGDIRDRESFDSACGKAQALLHVWPIRRAHAIDFVGRPIIRASRTMSQNIRNLRNSAALNPTVEQRATLRTASTARISEFVRNGI